MRDYNSYKEELTNTLEARLVKILTRKLNLKKNLKIKVNYYKDYKIYPIILL